MKEIKNRHTGELLLTLPDKPSKYLRLGGAKLHSADLRYLDLSQTDLEGADLSNADLTGTNLKFTFMCGANLQGAILTDADLYSARLSGANLQGAVLPEGVPFVSDLESKILDQIEADPNAFDMDYFHNACRTCHCIGGWAIVLAGDAGKALEERFECDVAAALIFAVSHPEQPVPKFYEHEDVALGALRARVWERKKSAAVSANGDWSYID